MSFWTRLFKPAESTAVDPAPPSGRVTRLQLTRPPTELERLRAIHARLESGVQAHGRHQAEMIRHRDAVAARIKALEREGNPQIVVGPTEL